MGAHKRMLKQLKNVCNYKLLGCAVNSNKVCKNKIKKSSRTRGWEACPYQMPGNFRWIPSFHTNGNARKCSPPKNGTPGYKSNTTYKCCKHGSKKNCAHKRMLKQLKNVCNYKLLGCAVNSNKVCKNKIKK